MWFKSVSCILATVCIKDAMPALFTSVSIPPKYDTDFSTHCSQASDVERSNDRHNARHTLEYLI
jgi:hypothetical protein